MSEDDVRAMDEAAAGHRLRHDAARRRAIAGRDADRRREARGRRRPRRARRRRHGGRVSRPHRPATSKRCAPIANRVKGRHGCRSGPLQRERHRAGGAGGQGAESPRIHTFIATSDIHLKHKLRMNRDEVLERVERMVRFAKGFTSDVEFSAEDATRSDWEFLAPGLRHGHRRRRDDDQRAGHGRLHLAARVRGAHGASHGERAGHREGHHLRPLPRRPRHGHGQHAGGGARRGAPGRSDHERHWRARRQHVAGRSR